MDTSAFAADLHDRRLQELTAQEAAQEAYQTPITQASKTRPIEAPTRQLCLPQDMKLRVDPLPTTLEHIPNDCLVRYLRIWTETMKGMVAGAYD